MFSSSLRLLEIRPDLTPRLDNAHAPPADASLRKTVKPREAARQSDAALSYLSPGLPQAETSFTTDQTARHYW
jgi:hypothetical protein